MLVFVLFSQTVLAATTCKKLDDCIELVTKLTETKYIYGPDLKKDDVIFPSEIELTKDNADILFSEALLMAGYTRLPTSVEKVSKIINARDIRYSGELPKFNASKSKIPELPKHSDYIMLTYQGVKGGEVGEIARNLRPFLSRYGRVIDMASSQLIVISDTANNVRNYLPIIIEADVVLTSEQRARREQRMKKELEQAKVVVPTASPATRKP